ncbi:MAG: SRPBCC domain-containing protein, partial [Saprospiraceae bacterium]
MENSPIILERLFNATPAKLWNALTDKNEMKKWYFDLPEFKAEIGFKFQFSGGPSPEKEYIHLCEITEMIHEKKLSYSWSYLGYSGIS